MCVEEASAVKVFVIINVFGRCLCPKQLANHRVKETLETLNKKETLESYCLRSVIIFGGL